MRARSYAHNSICPQLSFSFADSAINTHIYSVEMDTHPLVVEALLGQRWLKRYEYIAL